MEQKMFAGHPGDPVDTVRIRRSATVIDTELDRETVLLNMEAGVYSGFDEVGTRIWQLIKGRPTVAELRERLLAEYQVDEGACHQDLLGFLNELLEQGLVELDAGAGR